LTEKKISKSRASKGKKFEDRLENLQASQT